MPRLPTAKQVYDRIRWDPGLDPSLFTIGYQTRAAGVLEMPFDVFDPEGDIPWHRLRYIRMGDTVVWDRRTRTYELPGVRRRE